MKKRSFLLSLLWVVAGVLLAVIDSSLRLVFPYGIVVLFLVVFGVLFVIILTSFFRQMGTRQTIDEKPCCLFCDKDNAEKHRIIIENEFCYARWDNFPVSQGHLEIVPKQHIVSFFDLTKKELSQIFSLLIEARNVVQKQFKPDGYNIGLNEGEAAGRTVHHLHIHLIPRYIGDIENPRGGIRHIIPGKGNY